MVTSGESIAVTVNDESDFVEFKKIKPECYNEFA
jgi:hypothetical protein